jgi:hypothetical protein
MFDVERRRREKMGAPYRNAARDWNAMKREGCHWMKKSAF